MPKTLGGLGVLDLHCMNISLLLKWWWKLKDNSNHTLWKQIICASMILLFGIKGFVVVVVV
jgi:hypothetical protein